MIHNQAPHALLSCPYCWSLEDFRTRREMKERCFPWDTSSVYEELLLSAVDQQVLWLVERGKEEPHDGQVLILPWGGAKVHMNSGIIGLSPLVVRCRYITSIKVLGTDEGPPIYETTIPSVKTKSELLKLTFEAWLAFHCQTLHEPMSLYLQWPKGTAPATTTYDEVCERIRRKFNLSTSSCDAHKEFLGNELSCDASNYVCHPMM